MKLKTGNFPTIKWPLQYLLPVCLLYPGFAALAQSDQLPPASTTTAGETPAAPVYRPPLRGAPATRVGGGTRGMDRSIPRLHLLVPDHTALSSQSQPKLYWYVSEPVKARVEFAIINDDNFEILIEAQLPEVTHPGVQTLSLRDYQVQLQAQQDYQWSVALVTDPEQRSNDIVASGTIRYQPLEPGLSTRIQAHQGLGAAAAFAENGYWYDAVDTVSQLASRQPDHPQLIAWRALLLEQAGLGEVVQEGPWNAQSAPLSHQGAN